MIEPRLVFLQRASAMCLLVEAGEVDPAQACRELGAPTCDTCGALPCVNPSFCAACRRADARRRRGRR